MKAPVLLLALTLAASASAQRVVYVRQGAAGANDGTSWANAYRELRTALATVVPPAEVWVAAGTYKPETAGTDRTLTFRLRNGVALYGGFDGTETAREERDWTVNVTVLSGEIGSPTSAADNSCHVVTGSGTDSTAVLDGFAVTGGYARFCAADLGGGLRNEAGSPMVRNARFLGNDAVAGGGVYNVGGSAGTFADCAFEGNLANQGGGMANVGSSPRLVRVVFRNNTAADGGAMVSASGSNPVCLACVFEGNTAPFGNGGAIYNVTSAPLFVNARFLGNTSRAGGGAVWNEEAGADMVCLGCLFRENRSENGTGGAVYSVQGRPTFLNTAFEGNRAESANGKGGAIHLGIGSVARLYNVVLVGNRSGLEGGALHASSGWFEAVGLTAAGNRAGAGGQHPGAVLYTAGGGSALRNAVLWGNEGAGVVGGGSVEVRHALVAGGCAPPMICEAVADADPLFVRAPFAEGPSDYGDLRLRAGSPALDAGSVAHLPADVWDLDGDGDTAEPLPVDLLGQPRVQGASVDLGAYEGGVTVGTEPGSDSPAPLALAVAPNPARGAAVVTLSLPEPARARVEAFDVLGRRVATLAEGEMGAGAHRLTLDAFALSPGVYLLRVEAGGVTAVRRLVVAR